MTFKLAATNDEYTAELQRVFSVEQKDANGQPKFLGYEGWKSLTPSVEIINGQKQWFLSSGQSFSQSVGGRWARLENGFLIPSATMRRNCGMHGSCTPTECKYGSRPGCHGGKVECSHECPCGIYAHSNVKAADDYGGRGSVSLSVRLLATGKGQKTIEETIEGEEGQQARHLQSGLGIGVRSPESTITGIMEPTILEEANDEERERLEKVLQRFASAYGDVPILRRDGSSLTSSQYVKQRYQI